MTNHEIFMMYHAMFQKYSKQNIWIRFVNIEDNRPYACVELRTISMPAKSFMQPTGWDILCLLHEVGHVMTNTPKMRVFEREYYATQWAAEEAKKWGFVVKDLWKNTYQKYIWDKRQDCIRRRGKNIPSKEALVIKW